MTLPLQYTYLVGSLLSFIPLLVMYFLRPDLRRSMLWMIILLTPYGLFSEYVWWTSDWWRPITITHTRIGIEDLLLSIGSAGAIAPLFPFLFKKRVQKIKNYKNITGAALLLVVQIALLVILTQFCKLTSFYATAISYLATAGMLLYFRKDLLQCALTTAIMAVVISIPIYLTLFTLTPEFVSKTWMVLILLVYKSWEYRLKT